MKYVTARFQVAGGAQDSGDCFFSNIKVGPNKFEFQTELATLISF